ncbi:MAG: heavy-metal-associated domain-containing protein [Anaerolineae bacterium]|nr:heavy-metal-associated domain-containing protein [Anaerolineae bacterium]MCI0707872.1 heavy-metal-associated domain-containing protein [Ignavibacteriota bacterium]MCI0707929.1 heavy-metal-associated domain-containing protein [Ignavibacteriota bacterium]
MKTKELKIEGMSCGHCIMAVKHQLDKLSNVKVDDVQIGTAKVQVDEAMVTTEQLSRAIENAGYKLLSVN